METGSLCVNGVLRPQLSPEGPEQIDKWGGLSHHPLTKNEADEDVTPLTVNPNY